MEGGPDAEQASLELLMAEAEALPALLRAAGDASQPASGRAAIVDLLGKIHVREGDPRIVETVHQLLADRQPAVRAAAARALARMDRTESIPPLLERFLEETDEDVLLELLVAQETLDDWRFPHWGYVTGGASLSPADRERFLDRVVSLYRDAASDTLRVTAEEIYEKAVAMILQDADRLVVSADLDAAERKFREALDLKPDSRNAQRAYGRFLYFDGGQPERGLAILDEAGLLLRLPRLPEAPVIDGDLADPAWSHAAPIERFYQSRVAMRVVPAEGRAEFRLGYTDDHVWAATKVHEQDTSILMARYTDFDGSVWFDDSVCFFFDTQLTRRNPYRLFVNCLGTLEDRIAPREASWSSGARVATRIEPTYWTTEIAVPLAPLNVDPISPGDVWIFNAIFVRSGAGALPGAWAPTHGPFGVHGAFGLLQVQ